MALNKILSLLILALVFPVESLAAGQGCLNETCKVSQEDYEEVISNFKELYKSIRFQGDWFEESPQAFASFGRVVVSGGFARKDDINLGGFLVVICHEVGHALLSLNEGEADHFATKTCLKDYFKSFEKHLEGLSRMTSQRIHNVCSASSESPKVCAAVLVASQNAAQADANRCVKRLKDLLPEVRLFTGESYRVEEFHFRCLRVLPEVKDLFFKKDHLLESVERSLALLNSRIDVFVEDLRVVNAPYSLHNSPSCRMQTLREGYFNRLEPMCWK